MTGKYFFNEIDAFTGFGILFKKGANSEFLSMPGAWPDETRKLALPIYIKGNDEFDFWVKYNAFRSFLKSPTEDEFTLLVNHLHRRFKLSYVSMSNFTMLTKITDGNKVYCDFVLNVEDDYPDVKMYTRTGIFQKNNAPWGFAGGMVQFSRTYSSFTLADATVIGNADTTFNEGGQAYANVYGTIMPALERFIALVIADGGTVDQALFTNNYYA